MSEDKNVSKVPEKIKRGNRITRWFREMRSELKKVVWPTPKQVLNNSLVVLAVTFVSAIGVWAIDFVGSQIFQAIRLFGVR
jgi:preprotein translocase subunit SecE